MIPRIDDRRRRRIGMVLITGALTLIAATLSAQTTLVDARWMPWIGCWQASVDAPRPPAIRSPDPQSPFNSSAIQLPAPAEPTASMVCVAPAEGTSAVDVVSLTSGKVASRERVDASGERQQVDRDGCTGWRQAQWSADGQRVFLRAELACGPGLTRSTSGVMSMSPAGEWLDIQGMKAGGNSGVRVGRYRDAGAAPAIVAEVSRAIGGRELAFRTARSAAGAMLTAPDIIEASKQIDTAVVQSWLAERSQRFTLDPRLLVTLADAGVPGSVTDMMIAISYPDEFIVRQPAATMATGPFASERDSARIAAAYLRERGCYGTLDPFAYSPFGWGIGIDPYYSSSLGCSRYGYSPYYGYGYSRYSSYGYGYGPGYVSSGYATGPVIVIRGEETQHGKLVKGQGYTRGSSSSGSAETTRGSSSTGSGGRSSSDASTASSSGSSPSSGSSSSGSSDAGRTAKSRPPGH